MKIEAFPFLLKKLFHLQNILFLLFSSICVRDDMKFLKFSLICLDEFTNKKPTKNFKKLLVLKHKMDPKKNIALIYEKNKL